MVTCAACGEEVPAGARFCPACGRRTDPPTEAGERKLATMLFADLVGSTALTVGRDPEDVRATLERYFAVARAAVLEHGGTVEKFIGDAVMAVFGVPAAHGDDPDRAVATALALRDRVAALPGGLELRVGVATGEVLALGSGADLSVTGEAVNAAARVQQAAAPGQVLVDRRTASACRAAAIGAAIAVPAKGFAEALEVHEATGAEAAAPAPGTPLVGRDDDLDLLRLLVRRAFRRPAAALVTLVGEAGVGKTRLAQELVGGLRADGTEAPRGPLGRNPPYGRGIAFWALGEIVRTAAGCGRGDPPAGVRRALATRLEAAGADEAEAVAGGLALVLGESGDGTRRPADEVVRRAWRRLLAVLAAERPLVVVLEDVHWADEGLLDLVEESVRGLGDLPLVVLCTSRPELLERRPD